MIHLVGLFMIVKGNGLRWGRRSGGSQTADGKAGLFDNFGMLSEPPMKVGLAKLSSNFSGAGEKKGNAVPLLKGNNGFPGALSIHAAPVVAPQDISIRAFYNDHKVSDPLSTLQFLGESFP